MNKISQAEFEKLIDPLNEGNIEINGCEIELVKNMEIDIARKSFTFRDCIFKGARIDFYDFYKNSPDQEKSQFLSFDGCTIENDLFIKSCALVSLEFQNVIISSTMFYITSADIERITIIGSPEKYNSINSLTIDRLDGKECSLDIRLNEFHEGLVISNSFLKSTTINKNKINKITIFESGFDTDFSFWKNELEAYSYIDRTTFHTVKASECKFGKQLHFNKVIFFGDCNFEQTDSKKSRLWFSRCNFEKYVHFDNSNIHHLMIDSAFFKEIVSFQDSVCNAITINTTHFDKVAFFNDFEIIRPDACELKTIRVIKNQLLKTENKIDYLKYSALEQRILLDDRKLHPNDKIMLTLNMKSNYFGNNWMRGVGFTLKKGLQFFILLLFVNSFTNSDYPLSLNFKNSFASFSEILSEFLKFVFSLGFDNEEIQSNGFLYLIFIVAKIYIGYGIYQTIAAFKKYGKI